jgi:hypothetical protein
MLFSIPVYTYTFSRADAPALFLLHEAPQKKERKSSPEASFYGDEPINEELGGR